MNKLIVVFGGSFNPVTTAHLLIAEQLTNQYPIEKVLFMPVSDLYMKDGLVSSEHRINMLRGVCNTNSKFEVCTVEVSCAVRLYTIDSLAIIQTQYPDNKIAFFMGSDNLKQIHTWKGFDYLMNNFIFIVINRNGDNTERIVEESVFLKQYKDSFIHFQETIRNDGNSSYIRKLRNEDKSIRYLVTDEVYNYIIENELYV